MDTNFRKKDLTTVFNETWKSNHNQSFINKAKEKQQKFNNELYRPTDMKNQTIGFRQERISDIKNRLRGN